MEVTQQRIDGTKKLLMRNVIEKISRETGKPTDHVLREFLVSETYQCLMNDDLRLWADSAEKLYDIYSSERKNDRERFLWLLSPDR